MWTGRASGISRRRSTFLVGSLVFSLVGLPLALCAQTPLPDAVTVRVVDVETGDGVPGAAVRIAGGPRVSLTDRDGIARFEGLHAGSITFIASRFGYAESRQIVALRQDGGVMVRMALVPRPVPVAPVAVEAPPKRPGKMDGFDTRRTGFTGHFLTFEDIRRARPMMTSDLLRRVPGMRVSCPPIGPCSVRSTRSPSPRCPVQIFLDGVPAHGMSPDLIPPDDLEGIEIYRGASEIPPEFNRGSAMCGVIAIWTADPQRRTGTR